MVAVQNQLKQVLLNTQMSILNNSYKTSNNANSKNSVVNQLKTTVNQAETLQQPTQTQAATAGTTGVAGGNANAGAGPIGNVNVNAEGFVAWGSDDRTKEKKEADKKLIAELSQEFGIDYNKKKNVKDWASLATASDSVDFFSKDGKKLDGTGKDTVQGSILVINSKTHGQVKIAVGGDAELNGGDDNVLSVGGQTAAKSAAAGLEKGLALQQGTCPICKGAGCPQCSGKVDNAPKVAEAPAVQQAKPAAPAQTQNAAQAAIPITNMVLEESKDIIANHKPEVDMVDIGKVAQARDLAGSSEVQKVAGKNTEVAGLVGKSGDAYNMSKDEINSLLAALLLVASGREL